MGGFSEKEAFVGSKSHYDPSLATDKDKVRYLIGDTDEDDFLLTDAEISFALTEQGNIYDAGAAACEAIAALFAREVSMSADGVQWSGSDAYNHYMELASKLKDQASKTAGGQVQFYAGGRSKAEREADDADSDLINLHFRSHIHDNPEAVPEHNASRAELESSQ